ncbi:Response regulatory domain-containing protein [Candidatus Electrothrix aarhusensis]
MISNCPHCQGALKFNAAQTAKIEQALKALKPGKRLPLKCPHCKKPMQLDAAGEVGGAAGAAPKKTPEKILEKAAEKKAAAPADTEDDTVKPPPPPPLDFLDEKQGGIMEDQHVRDVPTALVLHADDGIRHQLGAAMEALGYQVVTLTSAQEAIDQVASISFATIVFHADFEGVPLNESIFHNYMREMYMSRRRMIFYILMGPQFTTLYDIQALANSANLVVSDKDFKNFQLVLHKAIPYYEQLFGPLLEELSNYGKT